MMVHATPSERFDRAEGSSPLRSDRAYYDPRWIKIELDWNARDLSSPAALAHIASLEESILADGVREAIKVKYDRATGVRTLVAGHCRLTACLNLIAKAAPSLLDMADNLARMVVDEDQSIDKVIAAARAYLKARGI